ncbi:hypothetical protein [Mesonia mobilis]|uniref:hypothetical protein n=1 Tax=Mesonia mobilis TaxID=369791 RepID=UPI0026EEF97D|nr:hypothetical protein [Mesonia mobilis]
MEAVNYIKHLNRVFALFSRDNRLNPSHISLYLALFQFWNVNYYSSEFFINRQEVMNLAKIGSKSTYHRCIRELSHWSYLVYMPSHNPWKGSKIKMFNFGTSSEQVLYPNHTKNRTSSEQALVSIIKHIQTIENIKNNKKTEIFENLNFSKNENTEKLNLDVPNRDNLKTSDDKNYDEPL